MANIFTRDSIVDPTAIDAVETGQPIGDLAVDLDTGALVATHYGVGGVTIYPGGALTSTGAIRTPGEPFEVAAAGDRAYVTTTSISQDAVAVLDTVSRAVIAEFPLAFGVTALAISPDGKKVFAGRSSGEHIDVAVIDTTAERVGTIDVAEGDGINIDALRVDAAGKRLYVAASDTRGSRLVVVDVETARVAATISIGDAPIRDLALGNDATAYVLTSHRERGGAVDVVDLSARRVVHRLDVGRAPVQLALSPDGSRAYVLDYNHVAIVGTRTGEVLHTVTVGARPSSIALSADGSRLYVADYAGGVTAFAVAPARPVRFSHSAPTDRILSRGRELQPAGA